MKTQNHLYYVKNTDGEFLNDDFEWGCLEHAAGFKTQDEVEEFYRSKICYELFDVQEALEKYMRITVEVV